MHTNLPSASSFVYSALSNGFDISTQELLRIISVVLMSGIQVNLLVVCLHIKSDSVTVDNVF